MGNIWSQQNHWETEARASSLGAGCPTLYIPFKTVPYRLRTCSVGRFHESSSIMVSAVRNRPIICQVKEGIPFGAFYFFPLPKIMLYMAVLMFPFIPSVSVPCLYSLSWIWGAGAESLDSVFLLGRASGNEEKCSLGLQACHHISLTSF